MDHNNKRQPSNADILAALTVINTTLTDHQTKIDVLMTWKTGVEAVDRYIARSAGNSMSDKLPESSSPPPVDWTKIVIAILGITGALVAVIATFAAGK